MFLKLRQKRSRHPRAVVHELSGFSANFFSYNELPAFGISHTGRPKLVADVHLFALENSTVSSAALKKILIVDDSPAEVKLIEGLLETEGYSPVGVNDPKRVEEAITAERPSVILLDVVMPDRNGFQVCRDLKSNTQFNGIPVILVTSKDTASDRYWGEQQGADGYVTKPFTREELLRAVRRFA